MKHIDRKVKALVKSTLLILFGIFLWEIGAHGELIPTCISCKEICFQGFDETEDQKVTRKAVPQGMAGNGNTVYVLKSRADKSDDTGASDRDYILKILNADTNSPTLVLPDNTFYAGHGNGMTYYNGYLYIASGKELDAIYRVQETNNSTKSFDFATTWTNQGTAHYKKEKLSVNGLNSNDNVRNIAHYSGNYFIICLQSNYSGMTNTLTFGVALLEGTSFTIQKRRFTVEQKDTYGAVQDIDYRDGYLWIVLHEKNGTKNHILLAEIPTSYSGIENGKTYDVKKYVSINENEAGRENTLNELESVYVYGDNYYVWSNIEGTQGEYGWKDTFCRYKRFPDGVTTSNVTTKSKTSLEITWNSVSRAERYRIDRRVEGGNWEKEIKVVGGSQLSYTDTGLTAGTKYYYRVYGLNSVAGTSPDKNEAFGVTRTATPKVNSVTAVSESELKVQWTAVTGAKKYIVCRRNEGSGDGWEYYTRIKEVIGTEYLDSDLEPNTIYHYGIVAVTETGVESGNPNENGNPGANNRLSGTTLEAIEVSLDKTSLNLIPDESYNLKAIVTPAYAANIKVNWTSSDSSVVSVDQDGKLTALEAGTAVITATEQMKHKTASCSVTVYKPDLLLPAELKMIEESAFEGTSARTVYIPDKCNYIGAYAFRNSSVEQIRIPANCEIGDGVFAGCEDVTILGIVGSDAEIYAQENGLGFIEAN